MGRLSSVRVVNDEWSAGVDLRRGPEAAYSLERPSQREGFVKTRVPCGGMQGMKFCRRAWLKATWGSFGFTGAGFSMQSGLSRDRALTKEERDHMSPDDVIAELKLGNERFRNRKPSPHDYVSQKRSSA